MGMDTSPWCCWGLGAGFMLIALGASAVYKPSAQVTVLYWQWREANTFSPLSPDLCSFIRLRGTALWKHTFLVAGSVSKAFVQLAYALQSFNTVPQGLWQLRLSVLSPGSRFISFSP